MGLETRIKLEPSQKKILWAVDAFPDRVHVQAQAGRAVRALAKGLSASVQPVWVARPEPSGLFIQSFPRSSRVGMKKAEKNVQWLVRLVSPPDAAPPRFIPARSPTLRSAVTTLIEYAEKHNFDLIAVGTHARKGVPRLFMGSFAETLIYKSPISVLISNSTASTLEEIKYVIFPSDLSDRSREVFERVVGVAKTLGVPILLFHQAQYSIQPEFVYPLIVPPVSMDSVEHSREVRRKQGQAWTAWARRNGVDAHFRLSEARGSVAENIMKVAKRLRSGIIAMATHTGPVGSTLIGSVTRQVIRTAVCPVLVFHPPPKKMTPPRKRTHRPSDSLPGRSLLS